MENPTRFDLGDSRSGLTFGPLGAHWVHLCIDMQRLFDRGSPWEVPWLRHVLPRICRLVEADPRRTVFTRFIPPRSLEDAPGAWRRLYERWPQILQGGLDPDLLRLLPELELHLPAAPIHDKTTYSPWPDGSLHRRLQTDGIDTLVLSGGETDVCLLAAALGAVDLGYRVIIAADAVCSSADDTHDAAMRIYADRLSQQIEMADTARIVAAMA